VFEILYYGAKVNNQHFRKKDAKKAEPIRLCLALWKDKNKMPFLKEDPAKSLKHLKGETKEGSLSHAR